MYPNLHPKIPKINSGYLESYSIEMTLYESLWNLKHYAWGLPGADVVPRYIIDVLMGNSWLTLLTTLWLT